MPRLRLRLLTCILLSTFLARPLPAQKEEEEIGKTPNYYRAHLILAIEQRDLRRAREVIEEGGSDVINRGDPSPLGEAVRLDQLHMVALLLRSGGDPNVTEDSPLREALVNDNIDMVRLLFQVGATLPDSAMAEMLQLTLRGDNAIAIYQELLDHGADVHVALRSAVGQRKLEATFFCLERGGDVAALGELSILELTGLTSDKIPEIVALALREETPREEASRESNRDTALSYFLSTAASAGHRQLADLALAEGGVVTLEHLERAEKQGHDEMALFLLEQLGGELSTLIRQAENESRADLAAYLKGLRNDRIGSVLGPVAAGAAALFVFLAIAFFLRKNVLHSPRRLFNAVAKGRRSRIEKLLKAGADPNAPHLGEPLLNAAAKREDLKVARLLVRYDADVNRVSETSGKGGGGTAPLHIVARNGSVPLAELLLRHGARPDVRTADGLTPLYLAARSGHGDMVHLLVERGADLQVHVKEQPLIVLAAMERDTTAVRWLLEAGGDPNANLGKTALHVAATTGDVEMIRLLLEHGADVYALDREGRAPHALALFHKHAEAVEELQVSPPPPPPPPATLPGAAPASAVAASPMVLPQTAWQPATVPVSGPMPGARAAHPASVFESLVIPPPDPPEPAVQSLAYPEEAGTAPAPLNPPASPPFPASDGLRIPFPEPGKK